MKKTGLLVSILLLFFIVTVFSIGVSAQKPYNQAKKEAFSIARTSAGLETMDRFYWYNGEETYFTIVGKDRNEEDRIVLIRQNDGKVTVLDGSEAVSEVQAKQITKRDKKPKRILEARIGISEEEPVWEISYQHENGKIGYYILSLETGEWIRSIENI